MPTPIVTSTTNGQNSQHSFISQLVCNAGGGSMGGYLCFPFESVKKRMQRGVLSPQDFYNLANGRVYNVLKPAELYRGSTPFATAVLVASVTQMTFNDLFKRLSFYDPNSNLHNATMAISSGILGAIVGSTPVENTILVQQVKSLSPVKAIKHMLNQGIARPWVGVRELMCREAGFAAVMLYAGPTANRIIYDKTQNKIAAFAAETAAGAIGAILTHPFDTLATRRQKYDGNVPLLKEACNMYAKEGWKVFFRGSVARVGLFVGCAVTIPRIANIISNTLQKD